jgi:hypothetical protein
VSRILDTSPAIDYFDLMTAKDLRRILRAFA